MLSQHEPGVGRAIWTLIATCLFITHAAGQSAASNFDTGVDGWRVFGNSATSAPGYRGTGGNPTGYIQAFDNRPDSTWYWQAPAAFNGNFVAAYGRTLDFDMRAHGIGDAFPASDVIITGGGIQLHNSLPVAPDELTWTHYSLVLSEVGGWKVGSLAGSPASAGQIQSVLGSITDLMLRGEFQTSGNYSDLDSVALNVAPAPGVAVILVIAGSIVGGRLRGRAERS
ncbi:MAG: hypothetical protein JSR77_01310 [Planctomycetes bacterium]|nr:hypothetical protein [Planctomycetota bacterium]